MMLAPLGGDHGDRLMPWPERRKDRRWGAERNDRVAEVLAVLLLDAGYIDHTGFGVRRARIERRVVCGGVDFIDLALICSSEKRLRFMLWSSSWARTNFNLD
jgi:hypothetical protein